MLCIGTVGEMNRPGSPHPSSAQAGESRKNWIDLMDTATILPNLAVGFAEKMAHAFEIGRVEELAPEEVSTAIRLCAVLQDLFAQTRRSIAAELSQGVEARGFAAKYERAVIDLEAVLKVTQRVVTKARTNSLPPPAEQFVSSYRALMDEMLSLHRFLAEAVETAKRPVRPVDWKRVQEAEAAFARGETKPFQRSSKKEAGE
jgi:hypothetical protein